MNAPLRPFSRVFLASLLFLALPGPSTGAELAVFVTGARPPNTWGRGFGASLTLIVFNLVGAELEGARQAAEVTEGSMLSLSGRVFLAPPFGRFVPYGGVAVGGYRQAGTFVESDWGTYNGIFLGVKIKLPLGLLAKTEYQWTDLPPEAPFPMDARFLLAGGVSF